MEILTTLANVHAWRQRNWDPSTPLVLVPTMGALHEGHLMLMREAKHLAGVAGKVAVSIFVNPTQFGPNEDFNRYPRELESDAAKCDSVGVDMIFAPDPGEVYAPDRSLSVLETELSKRLCGASRPGHFDGVCLVVLKLFNMVGCTHAVFGKKDYQQLAIIRRMVRDLNVPVILKGSETIREPDGLAMSSRNRYLTPEERMQAVEIRRGLLAAKDAWRKGEASAQVLKDGFVDHLQKHAPLHQLDYIECVNKDNLAGIERADAHALLATAVFFGKTRLIDNLELGVASSHPI